MENEYISKIQKLLALSKSPNENEAKAALLKARELMARHKINEADIQQGEPKVVTIQTGISYSKRRDPWINALASVISSNYCCVSTSMHLMGKQTHTIELVGLQDDVAVCEKVFVYAVDCIRARTAGLRKKSAAHADSYGYGFVRGVYDAFKQQDSENEGKSGWGLVMSVPTEVMECISDLPVLSFHAKTQQQISDDQYYRGYEEGKNFAPAKRLVGQNG